MFLTTDHLGTPVLATDAVGGEVWAGGFEPFGVDYADAGGVGVFLRFPGQWVDGLMSEGSAYNVNRWYQSGLGRYASADPISDITLAPPPMPIEPYLYAGSMPLTLVDPLAGRGESPLARHREPLGSLRAI